MSYLTFTDRLFTTLDNALKTLSGHTQGTCRPNPAETTEPSSTDFDTKLSASLMRINHTGEVCAQALYQGQAITARNPAIASLMKQSAIEENDHLQWCEQRLQDLNSHTSYLNPLWYIGSLTIGSIAGLAGDSWSLGFLAETERQVVRHLDSHIEQLPTQDWQSREILRQMRIDEEKHAYHATSQGAYELPLLFKISMTGMSLVMKSISKRI